MNLRKRVGVLTLTFLLLCAPAVAQSYAIVDLGVNRGLGINNTGQVTGQSETSVPGMPHAFLYSNGSMKDLGTLGGNWSSGYGINSTGQVTGNSTNSAGAIHAFLYSNGSMKDLGTLGGASSVGRGINSTGQVVGYSSFTSSSAGGHAFLYSNGSMKDLGTLGGELDLSGANAINNSGQVVGETTIDSGYHAFLYSNGRMKDLGTLGGNRSHAYGINSTGQVTGDSTTSTGAVTQTHAFLYSNGSMRDLGTLGGTESVGLGINSTGQVVGYSTTATDPRSHAFLYSNGKMTDLNSLLPSGSGWHLYDAAAINDTGQIIGVGSLNGQVRGFLMTPIGCELLDPVSSLLVGGALTTDVNVLAAQGQKVVGVATDGVARLVLRFNAPSGGAVTFSLVDSSGQPLPANAENGQIQTLQGLQMGSSTTVSTVSTSHGNKAFAVFTAPSQFVRATVSVDQSASDRQVFVRVQFSPNGGQPIAAGTTPVTLIRPMVFLVHGIWSSFETWDQFGLLGAGAALGGDPRFYVQRADYSWISDRGFAISAPVVYDQLTLYLKQYKADYSIAAVQADVVTHSMGGPVVRTMADSRLFSSFLADPLFPTFGKGPIRKLITIAGVHLGSPIADFIRGSNCLQDIFFAIGNNPYNGAVDDLKPSSAAIARINSTTTPFPVHTIIGVTDAASMQGVEDSFNDLGSRLCPRTWTPLNLYTIYGGRANDLLVPDYSQKGFDVPSNASTSVEGVVHSVPFDVLSRRYGGGNIPETQALAIANIVLPLLDIDSRSTAVWGTLPH